MVTYKNFKEQLQEETEGISIFTDETALIVGNSLNVDWNKIDFRQFVKGLNVELEHSDITRGSPILTAKIALAHLKELPDYYDRLEKMEKAK